MALIEDAPQLTVPPKIMVRKTFNEKIAERYPEYVEYTKQRLKTVAFVSTRDDICSLFKISWGNGSLD